MGHRRAIVLAVIVVVAVACGASEVTPELAPPIVITATPSLTSSAVASPTIVAPPTPATTPMPTSSPISVTWPRARIPVQSSAGGGDLALGTDGDTEVVHVVVSSVEEAWIRHDDELGTYADDASAYVRSRDGGRTWSSEVLLGGGFPVVAAHGHNVYVAYLAYSCGPGLGVQRNVAAGAKRAWADVICLDRTGDSGSDWAPAIAAGGGTVYVASLSDRGHAAVWLSRDHGQTWGRVSIGRRRPQADISWPGAIDVAASGRFVAVAWGDGRGHVLARVSTDAGRHWSRPEQIGSNDVRSAAAADDRIAFAGAAPERWIALWSREQGWTLMAVPQQRALVPETASGEIAVTLRPDGELGAVIPECEWEGRDNHTRWQTTADDGRTWTNPEILSKCVEEPHAVLAPDGRLLLLALGGGGYALSVRPAD